MTAEIGELNRHRQRLLRKTERAGTDHNQRVWVLFCERLSGEQPCIHKYGANGSDFHLRKCPKCQAGAKGLPFEEA
jgi:hypothetical protein